MHRKRRLNATIVSEQPADGYTVNTGEKFEKRWTLRNTGSTDWPNDTVLKFCETDPHVTDGEKGMGAPLSVGCVAPGAEKEVIVVATAPSVSGSCKYIGGALQTSGRAFYYPFAIVSVTVPAKEENRKRAAADRHHQLHTKRRPRTGEEGSGRSPEEEDSKAGNAGRR